MSINRDAVRKEYKPLFPWLLNQHRHSLARMPYTILFVTPSLLQSQELQPTTNLVERASAIGAVERPEIPTVLVATNSGPVPLGQRLQKMTTVPVVFLPFYRLIVKNIAPRLSHSQHFIPLWDFCSELIRRYIRYTVYGVFAQNTVHSIRPYDCSYALFTLTWSHHES